MPHHQNTQAVHGFSAYPPYPNSTDSIDSLSLSEAEAAQAFGDHDPELFFVEMEQQLNPWRRNIPSPMPRLTDSITQALAEAALTPLSPSLYSPWEGDFAPQPPVPAPGLNEYATMQAHARGRGPGAAPPPQPQSQPPPQPQYQDEHLQNHQDIYYRYSEASTSHSLPTQPFTPIYMSQNPSPSIPHPQQHQYAASIGPSSPAPLSDAEAEAKRQRNTAASARFRRKKKAREASLERQSREKREALAKLENRISELEDENKFLKGLILWKREGGEGKGEEEEEKSIVVDAERKGRERKDGVGT